MATSLLAMLEVYRMKDRFDVHMISLRNIKERNSFSTLFDDQEPMDWQLELLQDYIDRWRNVSKKNKFI